MREATRFIQTIFRAVRRHNEKVVGTELVAIPVRVYERWHEIANFAHLEKCKGECAVLPLTTAGVPFVYRTFTDANPGDCSGTRIEPTAVLYHANKRLMILIWAFEELVTLKDAEVIAEVFEMDGFDEPIPIPPSGGWMLLKFNPQAFTSIFDLEHAYCSGDWKWE